MRPVFVICVQILVLVREFNTQDYGKDPNDYSDEDSESDSHEVTNTTISDAVTDPSLVVRNGTDLLDNTEAENATTRICPRRANARRAEEDKSSTTLVNYPFSVSVQRKGAHHATGALIDKRWILSSAGEFYNVRESIKLFRARLGSVDCKRGGTIVPLKRVEIHPSYVYGLPNFDLALLRMAAPVDYTDVIRPIGLSKIKTKILSAKFMTTYWARLIVKGQVLPTTASERVKQNSMRVSTQRLIPKDKCIIQMIKRNITTDESTLCLKPFLTHHTVCTPDAGAPLVAEDGLWGITSGWTSKDCVTNPSPTVFCRLSATPVRNWLDTQMLSNL